MAAVRLWLRSAVRRILGETRRTWLRRQLVEARWTVQLIALPPAVALFQLRARRLAWQTDDYMSLTSATRPRALRTLLKLASGSQQVVELGTATGWTAISLALASGGRRVVSYDVVPRPEPMRYLELVDASVRARVQLVIGPGSQGPRDTTPVGMLYIDSSHDREQTVAEVRAWRAVLCPGAPVVFDDYRHPDYPGVAEAIAELGLEGEQHGVLFVHRAQ